MLVQIIIWAVTALVLVLRWMKDQKKKYPEPPTYPGALPFIGNALKLLEASTPEGVWNVLVKISNFSVEVGGVALFTIGPKKFYFISDPEDFSTIANKCLDKSYIYDFAKPWVGDGLVTSCVPIWKRNRKLFNPAFTQRALNRSLNVFNNQARRLVDQLAVEVGKGKFNHYWYVLNNMLETVNQTTLGLNPENSNMINKDYVEEASQLFASFIERLRKVWLQLPFLYDRSELKRRQDKIINKAKDMSDAVIRKRKAEFQLYDIYDEDENKIHDKCTTILDLILRYSMYNGMFSDDEIREHLETFIIASFDTTGTALVYALKLLGCHPSAQERLYKEIEEVFGDSDRDVEKDDLSKLVYLEAVTKETVRLYPVIPIIARTACNDVELKNYTIPSGSALVASIYGLNHHPAWGEDVDEFKPERWIGGKCPPAAAGRFAGFSLGRRNCIGELYALTVMKTVIVHILRRYRIIADDGKIVLNFNIFTKPQSGHHIALELRS